MHQLLNQPQKFDVENSFMMELTLPRKGSGVRTHFSWHLTRQSYKLNEPLIHEDSDVQTLDLVIVRKVKLVQEFINCLVNYCLHFISKERWCPGL